MTITFWQIAGLLLLIWVLYDLIAGHTWLHRKFERRHEPLGYWLVLLLWSAVALFTLGLI